MKSSRITLCVVVSILLAATVASRAQTTAATLTGIERRVTSNPGRQYDPSLSGDVVAFADTRSSDGDIYYVDLTTMTEHPVVVAPGYQAYPAVSSGRIVYSDFGIVLFNTVDNTTTRLTGDHALRPAISGDLVAWMDSRHGSINWEVYAKDIRTGEERRISNAGEIDQAATISGAIIAWERCVTPSGPCDIWSYDWVSDTTTQVTDAADVDERWPDIDGTRIVYYSNRTGNYDVCLFDLVTRLETCLPLDGLQYNPHVSGDNVSFDDRATGVDHTALWHLPTGDVFHLGPGTSRQYMSDIVGNRVVYTDNRNGDDDIYMFEFEISGDTTPPTITVTPGCPVTLTLNADFVVDVSVTDDGSGVVSQTVPNGPLALATASVGPHTLTIEATDHGGNSATTTCGYQVIYDFAATGGFASPLADQPAVNSAKAGSAVPVKWQLPDGLGGYISDLAAVTAITFGEVADFGGAPDTETEAATAGASGLRFDTAAQQFVFTWKTERTMAGRSYMLVLRLNDGTEYYANFSLR